MRPPYYKDVLQTMSSNSAATALQAQQHSAPNNMDAVPDVAVAPATLCVRVRRAEKRPVCRATSVLTIAGRSYSLGSTGQFPARLFFAEILPAFQRLAHVNGWHLTVS